MVFNCSATFSVICQTRTYCQLAPAATGFPLLSTKSEYPATGALGFKPPPGVSPVPAPVTTEGKTVVSVLPRSEEHTSELQSRGHLVCRLLLEKKNNQANI